MQSRGEGGGPGPFSFGIPTPLLGPFPLNGSGVPTDGGMFGGGSPGGAVRVQALVRGATAIGGGVLAGLGAVSLAAHVAPELALAARAAAAGILSQLAGGAVSPVALEVLLAGPVGRFALLPVGVGLLAGPAVLRRRRRGPAGEEEDGGPAGQTEPRLGFRARRRIRRQARRLAAAAGPTAAAELLFDAGLLDDAAARFLEAGEKVRAAEVRTQQGRPLEAAALYREAGRLETAGHLYAQEGEPLTAAECFAEAGCHGLAAEALEAGGDHAAAGRHYLEAGYLRHAARAFVRARDWLPAAEAIEAVVAEESRRAAGNPRREKELSVLVQKGARLFEEAGEPGEIVGAALYLASDASSYTTGAIIKIDGGMTAQQRSATVDIMPPSAFPKVEDL